MGMQHAAKSRAVAVVLGVVFIVLDQWVKLWALAALNSDSFHFGGSALRLDIELHLNPGAFLGLGAALSPQVKQMIFIVGVAAVVCWASWWAFKHWQQALGKAVAMYAIALGGVGNLIDRVFREGHVVDYLILSVGPLHTGVFNIADIAITAGAIYLAVESFMPRGRASGVRS